MWFFEDDVCNRFDFDDVTLHFLRVTRLLNPASFQRIMPDQNWMRHLKYYYSKVTTDEEFYKLHDLKNEEAVVAYIDRLSNDDLGALISPANVDKIVAAAKIQRLASQKPPTLTESSAEGAPSKSKLLTIAKMSDS